MNKQKVFGIGFNKTGTTSLTAAMHELGYKVGNQRIAELLIRDWAVRDFKRVAEYCYYADFFQDVPFSMPYTFTVLDHEFPNSKFILTVRDSAEQWYNSLVTFHSNKWGEKGTTPTKADLMNAKYIYKGWAWHLNRLFFNSPEDDPYEKGTLIKHYMDHISSVKFYFRHRPDDLLVLNVADKAAYPKLCKFLGEISDRKEFPWKNKTTEVRA